MISSQKNYKICFIASHHSKAQETLKYFQQNNINTPLKQADVVVCLGGDGFMLRTIHQLAYKNIPIYGINTGTTGFLLNQYTLEICLQERIQNADKITLLPLNMEVIDIHGKRHSFMAFNEVSLIRSSSVAAHIHIHIDKISRLEKLVSDGILLATPAGSTAYNNACYGPILPLGSNLLALTPISAFQPRHWRGAILPGAACVTLENLSPKERPITASADFHNVKHVLKVNVRMTSSCTQTLLFDPEHNLEERILKEQFSSFHY